LGAVLITFIPVVLNFAKGISVAKMSFSVPLQNSIQVISFTFVA